MSYVGEGVVGDYVGSYVGGVVSWLPTDLSSLIGWWDASDSDTVKQTTESGRVKTWEDKSGNGNDLYVNSSVNEPETGTATINGLNVIEFGETGAHYLSPNGALTGDIAAIDLRDVCFHVVFKQSATSSQGAIIALRGSDIGNDFISMDYHTTGNAYLPEDSGASTQYTIVSPSPVLKGNVGLIGFNCDADDMVLYSSGVEKDAEGFGATTRYNDIFILGYRVSFPRVWVGQIAEVIVSSALSEADRQAVEGYLANKWGV